VTEAVALGREPERRRGLRWWEPARRTCRQWRRTGARAQRGREENSNLGRDGGRHCFENNWLGGAGREREKGEGVGVHVGVGEGRGGWGYAAVGSAGRPVAAPRQRAWAVELFREQGRAAGCVRHGVAAADRWGRAATGTGCQR
jgi:hypothetical protein